MADIVGVSLVLTRPGNGAVGANVVVETKFSQREIHDNLDYGVNVAVVRDIPNTTLITRHVGMTAMHLDIIPPVHAGDLAGTSTRKVIKPLAGTVITGFRLENTAQAWPSGMKLKAVVTVVPEITEAAQVSQAATVA